MISLLMGRLEGTLETKDRGTTAGDRGDQKRAEWEWELRREECAPFPAPRDELGMGWGDGWVVRVFAVKA